MIQKYPKNEWTPYWVCNLLRFWFRFKVQNRCPFNLQIMHLVTLNEFLRIIVDIKIKGPIRKKSDNMQCRSVVNKMSSGGDELDLYKNLEFGIIFSDISPKSR